MTQKRVFKKHKEEEIKMTSDYIRFFFKTTSEKLFE